VPQVFAGVRRYRAQLDLLELHGDIDVLAPDEGIDPSLDQDVRTPFEISPELDGGPGDLFRGESRNASRHVAHPGGEVGLDEVIREIDDAPVEIHPADADIRHRRGGGRYGSLHMDGLSRIPFRGRRLGNRRLYRRGDRWAGGAGGLFLPGVCRLRGLSRTAAFFRCQMLEVEGAVGIDDHAGEIVPQSDLLDLEAERLGSDVHSVEGEHPPLQKIVAEGLVPGGEITHGQLTRVVDQGRGFLRPGGDGQLARGGDPAPDDVEANLVGEVGLKGTDGDLP